ncbi:MAG: hypothetical protein ACE5G2_10575 [Candidatus Krumholzibacteriia bacterium]
MTVVYILGAAVLLGALYAFFRTFGRAYWRFRGTRVITCPETEQVAAVHVDAKKAAFAALRGGHSLTLRSCTDWPERSGCGQGCLEQIEVAPEGCLVRTMLANWYEGKKCALCSKPIETLEWYRHKPALMDSERRTFELREIPAEKLPEVLQTHHPVCWNCHVIESLCRKYPDRVVYRS